MRKSLTFRLAELARKQGYNFKHDEQPEVVAMRDEIAALDNGINFEITFYPDGAWTAVSTNVEGIITGSLRQNEIDEMIKDAIFTYYGVSPQHSVDTLLRNTGEPVNKKSQVHVTA